MNVSNSVMGVMENFTVRRDKEDLPTHSSHLGSHIVFFFAIRANENTKNMIFFVVSV